MLVKRRCYKCRKEISPTGARTCLWCEEESIDFSMLVQLVRVWDIPTKERFDLLKEVREATKN